MSVFVDSVEYVARLDVVVRCRPIHGRIVDGHLAWAVAARDGQVALGIVEQCRGTVGEVDAYDASEVPEEGAFAVGNGPRRAGITVTSLGRWLFCDKVPHHMVWHSEIGYDGQMSCKTEMGRFRGRASKLRALRSRLLVGDPASFTRNEPTYRD